MYHLEKTGTTRIRKLWGSNYFPLYTTLKNKLNQVHTVFRTNKTKGVIKAFLDHIDFLFWFIIGNITIKVNNFDIVFDFYTPVNKMQNTDICPYCYSFIKQITFAYTMHSFAFALHTALSSSV